MRKHQYLKGALVIGLCTAVVLYSCSKSGSNGNNPGGGGGNGSDTSLVKLGTQVIVPAYLQLVSTTASLDAAVGAFNTAPNGTTLAAVQSAFSLAYKAWAACSEFEFGPASDKSLTTHFTNAFPTDTAIIKANAAGTAYVIDGLGNYAAQGFPAIDYLLYAYGSGAVLARFTSDANAAGAKSYLAALSASLKTKAAAVSAAWIATGGNYVTTFGNGKGVDAGSSLSLLANSYVLDEDVTLQNFKLGIPIGIYGPTTLPKSPDKVEAYYSGFSKDLLIAQVQAFQAIYLGGIDDKVAASKAQSNGIPLNDAIKNQLNVLLTKVQALPSPLSTGIKDNSTAITDAFQEVRKLTVLLKVDMSSALGIKISFQDDDGD